MIYIVGSTGRLGRFMCRWATAHGLDFVRVYRDLQVLRDSLSCGDAVINCAAITDEATCRGDFPTCLEVNLTLPVRLAEICAVGGATLVCFSTDHVLGGSDFTRYGLSKWLMEQALAVYPKAHVVRTSWLYTTDTFDPPLNDFVTWLRYRISANLDDERVSIPTTMEFLVSNLISLLEYKKLPKLCSIVPSGEATRFMWGKALKEKLMLPVDLVPVPSAFFPEYSSRPKRSVLDNSSVVAVLSTLGVSVEDWSAYI